MIKKILLSTSAFLTLAAVNVFGQTNVQNGGFETWGATADDAPGPVNWVTGNVLTSILTGSNPQSAYKVTDKTEGTYALKLVTVKLTNNQFKGKLPDTLGFAVNGSVVTSPSIGFKDRSAFTGRPQQLDFYTKYIPVNDDAAYASVELSHWNGTSRDIIAAGLLNITAITDYTKESVVLTYVPGTIGNTTPDSASVRFSSSKLTKGSIGSQLFLDDVTFSGIAGVKEKDALAAKVSVYPNPASEFVTITADINTAEKVIIYNQIGKQIGIYNLNNKSLRLSTASFAMGNYYYSILEKSGDVLIGGVFSVIK